MMLPDSFRFPFDVLLSTFSSWPFFSLSSSSRNTNRIRKTWFQLCVYLYVSSALLLSSNRVGVNGLEREVDTVNSILGSRKIATNGSVILVDDKPFFVKGVAYSPVPIGDNPVYEAPYGDYYTKEYSHLWERDFPLIKDMGANTIRVYGWDIHGIHDEFLDFAYKYNLMVIITFYIGTAVEHPVSRPLERSLIMSNFLWQVRKYKGHPAILAWSFGNEINGDWNHFLQGFSDAYNCNYNHNAYPADPNGCYYYPFHTGVCGAALECVYSHLFGFLDAAAEQAHAAMVPYNALVISSLADVDIVIDRIGAYELYTPHLDAWGVHLYRGDNFGIGQDDFLAAFPLVSKKPLLVTEFGVDAYRDACGSSDATPCYNTLQDSPPGFGEDQEFHSAWNIKLATLLLNHSSATGLGSVAGGVLMAWHDEWWKAAVNVKGCFPEIDDPHFQPHDCDWKGHVDCPLRNLSFHTLCGYFLGATFDHYVNEAWFGVMSTRNDGGIVDKLTPRKLYTDLQTLWKGPPSHYWSYLSVWVVGLAFVLAVAVLFFVYLIKSSPCMKRQQQVNNGRSRNRSKPNKRDSGTESDDRSARPDEKTPLLS